LAAVESNRTEIVRQGGVDDLLQVALVTASQHAKEAAVAALVALAAVGHGRSKEEQSASPHGHITLGRSSATSALVKLAHEGQDDARKYAALAIYKLARSSGYASKFAANGGIEALLAIIECGTSIAVESAVQSLTVLAALPFVCAEASRLRAVRLLLYVARFGSPCAKKHSMEALGKLCEANEANKEIFIYLNGVPVAVEVMHTSDGNVQSGVCLCLGGVAKDSADSQREVLARGGVWTVMQAAKKSMAEHPEGLAAAAWALAQFSFGCASMTLEIERNGGVGLLIELLRRCPDYVQSEAALAGIRLSSFDDLSA
jgi:hypothetical protein